MRRVGARRTRLRDGGAVREAGGSEAFHAIRDLRLVGRERRAQNPEAPWALEVLWRAPGLWRESLRREDPTEYRPRFGFDDWAREPETGTLWEVSVLDPESGRRTKPLQVAATELAFGAGTAAGSFGQFLFSPLAVALIEKGRVVSANAAWRGLMVGGFTKFVTFLFFVSLFYHAWIGVRDIWMDYVKPTGIRLSLHVLTIAALVGYTAWAAAILWRL